MLHHIYNQLAKERMVDTQDAKEASLAPVSPAEDAALFQALLDNADTHEQGSIVKKIASYHDLWHRCKKHEEALAVAFYEENTAKFRMLTRELFHTEKHLALLEEELVIKKTPQICETFADLWGDTEVWKTLQEELAFNREEFMHHPDVYLLEQLLYHAVEEGQHGKVQDSFSEKKSTVSSEKKKIQVVQKVVKTVLAALCVVQYGATVAQVAPSLHRDTTEKAKITAPYAQKIMDEEQQRKRHRIAQNFLKETSVSPSPSKKDAQKISLHGQQQVDKYLQATKPPESIPVVAPSTHASTKSQKTESTATPHPTALPKIPEIHASPSPQSSSTPTAEKQMQAAAPSLANTVKNAVKGKMINMLSAQQHMRLMQMLSKKASMDGVPTKEAFRKELVRISPTTPYILLSSAVDNKNSSLLIPPPAQPLFIVEQEVSSGMILARVPGTVPDPASFTTKDGTHISVTLKQDSAGNVRGTFSYKGVVRYHLIQHEETAPVYTATKQQRHTWRKETDVLMKELEGKDAEVIAVTLQQYLQKNGRYSTNPEDFTSTMEQRDQSLVGDCDVIAELYQAYLEEFGIRSQITACLSDDNRDGIGTLGEAHAIVRVELPSGKIMYMDPTPTVFLHDEERDQWDDNSGGQLYNPLLETSIPTYEKKESSKHMQHAIIPKIQNLIKQLAPLSDQERVEVYQSIIHAIQQKKEHMTPEDAVLFDYAYEGLSLYTIKPAYPIQIRSMLSFVPAITYHKKNFPEGVLFTRYPLNVPHHVKTTGYIDDVYYYRNEATNTVEPLTQCPLGKVSMVQPLHKKEEAQVLKVETENGKVAVYAGGTWLTEVIYNGKKYPLASVTPEKDSLIDRTSAALYTSEGHLVVPVSISEQGQTIYGINYKGTFIPYAKMCQTNTTMLAPKIYMTALGVLLEFDLKKHYFLDQGLQRTDMESVYVDPLLKDVYAKVDLPSGAMRMEKNNRPIEQIVVDGQVRKIQEILLWESAVMLLKTDQGYGIYDVHTETFTKVALPSETVAQIEHIDVYEKNSYVLSIRERNDKWSYKKLWLTADGHLTEIPSKVELPLLKGMAPFHELREVRKMPHTVVIAFDGTQEKITNEIFMENDFSHVVCKSGRKMILHKGVPLTQIISQGKKYQVQNVMFDEASHTAIKRLFIETDKGLYTGVLEHGQLKILFPQAPLPFSLQDVAELYSDENGDIVALGVQYQHQQAVYVHGALRFYHELLPGMDKAQDVSAYFYEGVGVVTVSQGEKSVAMLTTGVVLPNSILTEKGMQELTYRQEGAWLKNFFIGKVTYDGNQQEAAFIVNTHTGKLEGIPVLGERVFSHTRPDLIPLMKRKALSYTVTSVDALDDNTVVAEFAAYTDGKGHTYARVYIREEKDAVQISYKEGQAFSADSPDQLDTMNHERSLSLSEQMKYMHQVPDSQEKEVVTYLLHGMHEQDIINNPHEYYALYQKLSPEAQYAVFATLFTSKSQQLIEEILGVTNSEDAPMNFEQTKKNVSRNTARSALDAYFKKYTTEKHSSW